MIPHGNQPSFKERPQTLPTAGMLQTLPVANACSHACPSKWQPELRAIHLALQHPDTRWPVRLLARLLVIYAASPFDLIPDFIPWVGRLDNTLLIPLLIILVSRLMPDHVMRLSRVRAALGQQPPRIDRWPGAILVLNLWLMMALLLWFSLPRPL